MKLGKAENALDKYGPAILETFARKLELETELWERDVEHDDADPDTNRIYTYFDAMEWKPVRECIDTLGLWARRDDDKDITILLNSPGGYCVEGYALYDWIVAMRREYRKDVEIVGLGQVSSMASVVIQAATHRVMHKNAWLLIHEVLADIPKGYYDQKLSIIEEELEQSKRVELQGTKLLAARSKMTVKEIIERTFKRDWWLTSKEALEYGFVDEVR